MDTLLTVPVDTQMLCKERAGINNPFHYANLMHFYFEEIFTLCKIVDAKDGYTGKHCIRVGEHVYRIAKKVGLGKYDCEMLREASKIHDIGKVTISDKILNKKGRLTKKEYEEMKQHTTRGYDLIKDSHYNYIIVFARDIVLYHHERYDGSGYHGLRHNEIPLCSRMVAVADTYDALTHERPYKPAWPHYLAAQYLIDQSGKAFDKDIVDIFVHKVLAETDVQAG